jgi:hypothetical protein
LPTVSRSNHGLFRFRLLCLMSETWVPSVSWRI